MAATNQPGSANRIKSTDTMFAILETIQSHDGAGVTEIASELGVSKSTVHSHLSSLLENRCVVKEGTTYHIGLRFLNFGGYARNRNGRYDIIKPEIDGLVEETGESAKMLVEEHGRGIYLYQARGDRAVKTDSHVGTEVYLHCTALGKAILAHLPEERVHEIVDRHGLPEKTPKTITDRNALFDELEAVRSRGYARDDGERIPGIRCIAAPIRMDGGEVLGAMSVSGPTKRLEGERFRTEIPELVCRAARVVEINATYT